MTTTKETAKLLDACLGETTEYDKLVEYSTDGIVSKTILDKPAGTITLFAFDRDQKLSEHIAPFDAVVQIINGAAKLTIGGEDVNVSAGQMGLLAGADDFGGILLEEHVHKLAGHSRSTTAETVKTIIRRAGFTPAQRDSFYTVLQTFERPQTPGISAGGH